MILFLQIEEVFHENFDLELGGVNAVADCGGRAGRVAHVFLSRRTNKKRRELGELFTMQRHSRKAMREWSLHGHIQGVPERRFVVANVLEME
jgi:hypothetical protein